MSDSRTLSIRNPGSVAELEEWKRPREPRGNQPANRAALLKDDVQLQRREDRAASRNVTAALAAVADTPSLPASDTVLTADAGVVAKSKAADLPASPLVPPSKMAGGWFREDPW